MAGSMRAVLLRKFGGVEEMFVSTIARPVIKQNEILMKILNAGVNRMDILQRRGKYPPLEGESHILGPEAAGIVEESKSDRFKIGEKVMALLPGGGYAEYAAVHHSLCMHIPAHLSFPHAACIPEVWLTAFQLLHELARIKEGDAVLIHAGASGVGTAAIQLCKRAKAKAIIITAGSKDKINKCKDLGATHGVNYKELNGKFSSEVLNITDGSGVDIVLDCVGASYFEENLKCCAADCRWVLYGLMGGTKVEGVALHELLAKRIHLLSSTLRSRSLTYKEDLIRSFSQQVLPRFENGVFKAICDSVYMLSEVQAAHLRVEQNLNFGKVVLQNDFEDEEQHN